MYFDHERLHVYQRALEALDVCDKVLDALPRGRAHLKDQLDRAVTSIVLNVAEGAGEYSAQEKKRFYRMARRSATESAAILEIMQRRNDEIALHAGQARELLARVVAMLIRLSKDGP